MSALGAACPKGNLTLLLSDNWLDDEIIDMTMHDLVAHVHLDPKLSKTTVVAPLCLQSNIEQVFSTHDYSKLAVPLLYQYTEIFKQKKVKAIILAH